MIPKLLQDERFNFCLILAKQKKPFEQDWPNKQYKYNSPILNEHIKNANYGVICGGESKLIVVDFDNDKLIETIAPKLPETFSVKTGSGKLHKYYFCDDTKAFSVPGIDIRGDRTQVVAPGSTHPSGNKYEVLDDLPIASIQKTELCKILGVQVPKKETKVTPVFVENVSCEISELLQGVEWRLNSEVPKHNRSEAEASLVSALLSRGATKAQVFEIMSQHSKIGKWNEAGAKYQEKTYEKASQFMKNNVTNNKKSQNNEIDDISLNILKKENEKVPEDVLAILRNSSLIELYLKELDKKIVGEKSVKKLLFLVMAGGSLCQNATSTSTNICINSKSGAGKDAVVSCVADLFESEIKIFKRTKISPQAFTYWKQPEIKNGFTWNGKIVYLEDIGNSFLNCDTFKTMASGGSRATIVKEQQARDILIQGKPVLIITTAESEPKLELARRFPMVYLDESKEQTRAIIKRIGRMATFFEKVEYDSLLVKALSSLKSYNVIVPFGEELAQYFADYDSVMFRTHVKRIIDFVKFSAVIHQYQRDTHSNGELVATWEDWDCVRDCIESITRNKLGFSLTHKQKKVVDIMQADSQKESWSVADILAKKPPYTQSGLYKALESLVEIGILSMTLEAQEKKKDVALYKLQEQGVSTIPSSQEILSRSSGISGDSRSSRSSGINNNIMAQEPILQLPLIPLKIQPFQLKKVDITHLPCACVGLSGMVCGRSPCAYELNGKPLCEDCSNALSEVLD